MSGDTQHHVGFSFDEWMRLAREDPEAFERKRREATAAVIDSAPPESRARLEGLQWQIDQQRKLSGTAMGACVRLSRMMLDSVYGKGGLQEHLEYLVGTGPSPTVSGEAPRAEVLDIRRTTRSDSGGGGWCAR